MSAYSMDLRERIVAACAEGATQKSVAQRFGVCAKTVQRYVARAAAGALAPRPLPGRAPRVDEAAQRPLQALVSERPDWTLDSLSAAWTERTRQHLPRSTLHDSLKRAGLSYKKKRA